MTRRSPRRFRRPVIVSVAAALFALAIAWQAPPRVARAAFAGGNGKILFESDRDGDSDIFVMNADGSGQSALTTNSARDSAPRWSADGQRIVFASDRDNGVNAEVYVMNADGSGQTRLTFGPGSSGSPAWSPDGNRIAFSSDRDGNLEIYAMNADGSGVTRLTNHPQSDNEPVWSPDGSRILFYSDRDGDLELFVMNADGSGLTQLTFNAAINDVQPDWSPDGSRIAFARGPFGSHELEIWVMNADGSNQVRLTNNPAIDNLPSFSPDGTRLLFSSDRSGNADIYVMSADGAGQTPLTTSAGSDVLADWQPVQPDGIVSRWRAEGDALDSVGNNDGTLENGTAFATGKSGLAFSFDGIDDQIVVPHSDALNPGAGITIAAWVKTSSSGHGRPIAQMRTTANDGGYTFETTHRPHGPDDGLQWVLWFSSDPPNVAHFLQTPAGVLTPGSWHHVAATFDGKVMRIFVDGTQRAAACADSAESPATGCITERAIDPSAESFVVGRNIVIPSFAWHGLIDELEVYSRALNTAEIQWVANNPDVNDTPATADLQVVVDGASVTGAGNPLTYTVTVTNLGPATATGVVVTDTLPNAATFVSAGGVGGDASAWACQHANGIVTCTRASLPSSVSSSLAIVVRPTALGTLGDTAAVAAREPDPNPGNNINGVTTQVIVAATTTTIDSTPRPSALSQAVTLTASVVPATATGLVTFYDGPAVIGIRPVINGQATLTTTFLPAGIRSLTALYGGDLLNTRSRSAPRSHTVQAVVQDSFHSAVQYSTSSDGRWVAVGDFNADARADLVVAVAGGMVTLRGNGDGTFQPAAPVLATQATCCRAVAVGDFNADGRDDLAAAGAQGVDLLLGTGTGTFGAAVNYSTVAAESIVLGDLNNDGQVDIVTTRASTDAVGVLLNLGGGLFQAFTIAVGNGPSSVALADFNRDGNLDLAIGHELDVAVQVRLGNGTGTFGAAQSAAIPGQQVLTLAAHDFNRDGNPDLVVAGRDTSSVHLLIGAGNGTFSSVLGYPLGFTPRNDALVVADLFGDTFPDIAVTNSDPATVTVLSGLPGIFFNPTSYATGGLLARHIAAGDFNGDGGTDLVVANIATDNVSVFLGRLMVDTTTTLDSTPSPSTLSQAVTLRASVAPATATGLVTFYDGPKVIGVRPLINGDATLTTTFLPAGNRTLTALYPGDPFRRPSRSAPRSHAVQGVPHSGFLPAVTYKALSDGRWVAVGDFNGDARADLVVAVAGGMVTLRGNGDGTFQPAAAILATQTTCCRAVAVGDFNADGRDDLAAAGAQGVDVLLGNGTGTFGTAINYLVGAAESIVLGDINNDGRVDIVVTRASSRTVGVLLGLGTGQFQAAPTVSTGEGPTSIDLADFNRDGNLDLAIGHELDVAVQVRLGNGTGTFGAAQSAAIPGQQVLTLAAHDFNRDGNPDLVVAGRDTSSVHLLIGAGNGTFSSVLGYPLGFTPRNDALVVADLFGDTFPDIAVTNSDPATVTVLSGLPGIFFNPTTYATGGLLARHIAAADFNGDGGTDLVVANIATDNVSILLGAVGATRVEITTLPAGREVIVDGASHTAPHAFFWFPATTHTVATTSPQTNASADTRYLFTSWSDGGAISHSVTAPSVETTYTANFTTQYRLNTVVSPSGGGAINASPVSATGYYDAGTTVQLAARPTSGFTFVNWFGNASGTTNPTSIVMNQPRDVGAAFLPPPCAVDVTGSLDIVRGGFRLNLITGRWIQGVTIRNRTGGAIPGPLALALDNLSGFNELFNAVGATACAPPAGSPFVTVNIGTDGVLTPGESVTITLEFSGAGRIAYTPRVLSGANR